MSIEITFAAIGALATLVSTLLGALSRPRRKLIALANEAPFAYGLAEDTTSIRNDAKWQEILDMLERETARVSILRWSSTSLVFGQFVVGGLPASSFVTKNLGDDLIGALGVIVLGASLSNQHFRPDLAYRVAQRKVKELEKLRRWLSDEIYDIERTGARDKISALRRAVTAELDRIEAEDTPELRSGKNEKSG